MEALVGEGVTGRHQRGKGDAGQGRGGRSTWRHSFPVTGFVPVRELNTRSASEILPKGKERVE